MPLHAAVHRLTAPAFLEELHHLVDTPPGVYPGWGEDLGWSCRDHALLGGLVARLLGLACRPAHGEACFVQGPAQSARRWVLRVRLHAWLDAGPAGVIDLSPRLGRCDVPPHRPWPLRCVAGGRCLPEGTCEAAASDEDYRRRVGLARHTEGACTAVYYAAGWADLDRGLLARLPGVLNSPLAQWLARRYPPGVYSQAARHLFGRLRDERRSLRHLSQREAWDAIAAQPGDACAWLIMKGAVA
jgi:hypothetical protein